MPNKKRLVFLLFIFMTIPFCTRRGRKFIFNLSSFHMGVDIGCPEYSIGRIGKKSKKQGVTPMTRIVSGPFDEDKCFAYQKKKGKNGGIGLKADSPNEHGEDAEG